jgi:mercuric ion transport protein
MAPNRLLATSIIGFVLSRLGWVASALVTLLAPVGVSGSMGWLDYVLLPAIAVFAELTSIPSPVAYPARTHPLDLELNEI